MSCQWNILSFPLKNFFSVKFRILNIITLCCRFAYSFKSCLNARHSALKFSLRVPFKELSLVERAKAMFCLSVALKARSPRFMNFGLLLMMEFARFNRMLGSKLVTISSGRLFTPTLSMHEKSKFLSWVAYPSTEVSNCLMFLDHLVKLELLLRLGLKKYTLTPGFL